MNRSKCRLEPDSCGPWEPYIRGVACRCHLRSLVPNCVNHVSRQHVNNTRQRVVRPMPTAIYPIMRCARRRCGLSLRLHFKCLLSSIPTLPSAIASPWEMRVPTKMWSCLLCFIGLHFTFFYCFQFFLRFLTFKFFFCYAYLYPCKPLVSVVIRGLNYELWAIKYMVPCA